MTGDQTTGRAACEWCCIGDDPGVPQRRGPPPRTAGIGGQGRGGEGPLDIRPKRGDLEEAAREDSFDRSPSGRCDDLRRLLGRNPSGDVVLRDVVEAFAMLKLLATDGLAGIRTTCPEAMVPGPVGHRLVRIVDDMVGVAAHGRGPGTVLLLRVRDDALGGGWIASVAVRLACRVEASDVLARRSFEALRARAVDGVAFGRRVRHDRLILYARLVRQVGQAHPEERR